MPGVISAEQVVNEEEDQHYILVFHDQSHDTVPTAKHLLVLARQSRVLKSVVDACSASLRQATAYDTRHSYSSIAHALRTLESQGDEDAVSSSVLSCFNQFGYLALLWDQSNSCLPQKADKLSSIGLCTGSLAAAAALFVASEEDIVRLASELVAVSYRLGLEVDRRSRAIDPKLGSWSFALRNATREDAQKALDEFNESNSLPVHRHAYISAVLLKSLTISGPPTTLELLLSQGNVFPNAKHRSLPIYGAFHASHLICPELDKIMGNARLDQYKRQPDRSLIFPRLEDESDIKCLSSHIRRLIQNCFQNVLILEDSSSPLPKNANLSNYRLISVGESGHAENVQEWLCGAQHMPQVEIQTDSPHPVSDDIAIVGYAGRFPQAENLDEFWSIIVSGKDVYEYMPDDRFDAKKHYDSTARGWNTTSSPYGCFLKQPGAFDNAFFNLSPREALSMDPTQRLLLTVTQEALEMAGYSKAAVQNKRVGTFFGQATDDWRESHASQNIDIFYVGGGMRAFAPGRLNYHFKWEGPSYSVDTACSSSLAALEFAYKAVQSGDCDMAVAGGGNLISALPMFSGLSKGKFTSSTGSCKTFDVTADGYCRGEGVAVVVIKRLQDALDDNDSIKGLVSGIRTNHCAYATSITHPHGPTQATLMRSTLDMAGVKPHEIDYVEFHGTGTQAGDATELSSVGTIFGESKKRQTPLYIGAVKANVGHGEAAAGVTSLIKTLLMLKHDTIPPHAGIISDSNQALKEGISAELVVPEKAFQFDQSSNRPRRIMINNFNATGGNTSLILRNFSRRESSNSGAHASHYPIALSARSLGSLQGNLKNLKQYIADNPDLSLPDLSYTTTVRRQHFPYREAFVVESTQKISDAIDSSLEKCSIDPVSTTPTAVFAFAGQGTQVQGIAAQLFKEHAPFRQTLLEYNELCSSLGLPSFLEFVTDPELSQDWNAVQLQLGVVAVEMALSKLWQDFGVFPEAVIGHSLGEYAALCVAGVLSLADMFFLVGERAKLMEKHCKPYTQAMLSVSQSAKEVENFLKEKDVQDCGIACYNSDKAVALSGPIETLDRISQQLSDSSIKSKRLDVRYAFHSSMMDPILEPYQSIATPIPFLKPQIPVISTLKGSVVTEEGIFNAQYVTNQMRKPVNFVGALKAYKDFAEMSENTTWIELGPGSPSCLPLIQGSGLTRDRTNLISSFDTRSKCWDVISTGLNNCYKNGFDINWAALYDSTNKQPPNLIDLPHYAFDSQIYWIPSQPPMSEEHTQPKQRLGPLLHFLENAQQDDKTSTAEFSSDLSDPELFKAIHGHLVFKAALCPSSVYSAIALEAATYLYNESEDTKDARPQLELYNMEIQQPLVVKESSEAKLNIKASRDLSDSIVSVEFQSSEGESKTYHGVCKLRISDAETWRADWNKVDFLVKTRADDMRASQDESMNRLNKAVIYKLFSHVVEYDSPYHGIKSIVLDNKQKEATAEVGLDSDGEQDHIYDWHLIDTLVHLSGFVLNNGIEDTQNAFISDGWSALMIPPSLRKNETYTCYTRMSPSEDGKVFSGDVYALAQGKVVAACIGLRFVRMAMKSLQSFISKHAAGSTPMNESETNGAHREDTKPNEETRSTRKSGSSRSGVVEQVSQIIAEESGVSLNNITDKASVQDLGLDSILITQVVDRITQQTGIEISADTISSAPSFGELKATIASLAGEHDAGSGDKSRQTNGVNGHSDRETGVNGVNGHAAEENRSPSAKGDRDLKSSSSKSSQNQDIGDIFRDVIAHETDVPADKVEKAGDFNEIGLDSMLTTEVLDVVKEKTGEELPSSFLKDNTSMKTVREALKKESNSSKQPDRSSTPTKGGSPNGTNRNQEPDGKHKPDDVPAQRDCKITFLQGDKSSSGPPLILLPPGMGTTAVYTQFPKNPDNIAMYALQSPFLNTTSSEDFSMEGAAEAYIEGVNKIRSSGPIHIGGWSIGGALAYEVACRLIASGRKIISLIIIDCPFPHPYKDSQKITTDALTMMGYEEFTTERHGTFPRYLTRHVTGAMNSFRTYDPAAMSENNRPDYSCFVSATLGSQENFLKRALISQGILDQIREDDGQFDFIKGREMLEKQTPETKDFVTEPKKDASEVGWNRLIGEGLEVKVVDADHISLLLEDEPLSTMTTYIYDFLRRCSSSP